MVVDQRAVPVVAGRRARNVADRRAQQRDAAGSEQRGLLVLRPDRHADEAECVVSLGKKRGLARLEQHALQVACETAARPRVAQHGPRECGLALGGLQRATRPGGDDRQRDARASLQRAVVQDAANDAAAGIGHVTRGGLPCVVLAAHVGVLHALERPHRVGLRECRHAPGPDGRADQFDRRGPLQPFAVQQFVERDEREPLRAAGRRRDAGDVGGRHAVRLDVGAGSRARSQGEDRR